MVIDHLPFFLTQKSIAWIKGVLYSYTYLLCAVKTPALAGSVRADSIERTQEIVKTESIGMTNILVIWYFPRKHIYMRRNKDPQTIK